MVVSKLLGGLGNQMFQYAVGRAVALRHGVPLKLDVAHFESYELRDYQLHRFNIAASVATSEEVARLTNAPDGGIRYAVLRRLERLMPYYYRTVVRERGFSYDPNLRKVRRNVYLDGYWQDARYFIHIQDVIRRELTPASEPTSENARLLDNIDSTNSVSLHVRRADYVHNEHTNQHHGLCSIGYYQKAVEWMCDKIADPHFYLFSDDPDWVAENLTLDHPSVLVRHNGPEDAHEDMRLMSRCKNHIIANSTFSWWGAWLNPRAEKKVVAPARWFAAPSRRGDSPALASWHRIYERAA